MKKAILPAILLCTVMMTGCYDDGYADSGPTAVSHAETAETAPVTEQPTEGVSDEATETSSEMMTSESMMTEEQTEPKEAETPEPTTEPSEPETCVETETETAETEPAETEQPTEPETTEPITEPITEPERSDFDKALEVYEYMLQNGHGTCVNYACQTYEKCQEIGLPCYIVWTDAKLYGHTANTVQVDGIWFILDTQGHKFLTYNHGFTEVVDMEMNHIGDAEMLSRYRYDELFG
ncbi:MAG: hypothetical protein J5851_01535 [Oscillospiraceae bacterium]|nr:hypothetical protein [Oscillospiraceae bacterium]